MMMIYQPCQIYATSVKVFSSQEKTASGGEEWKISTLHGVPLWKFE
jgi:hypothetical protein